MIGDKDNIKKSHKKVKVDEVLFYSGTMPKTIKDKPEGKLLVRITADCNMVRPLECGRLPETETSLIGYDELIGHV